MTYFCWRCRGEVDRDRRRCPHCGGETASPPDADYTDLLIWALDHPLPERRIMAADILGRRRDVRGRDRLREIVGQRADPYLAAVALRALVAIDGAAAHRDLLDQLIDDGPAPVRAIIRQIVSCGLFLEPGADE
jgi:hypothetical protein